MMTKDFETSSKEILEKGILPDVQTIVQIYVSSDGRVFWSCKGDSATDLLNAFHTLKEVVRATLTGIFGHGRLQMTAEQADRVLTEPPMDALKEVEEEIEFQELYKSLHASEDE